MKLLYFFYALKRTDFNKLFKYVLYVSKMHNRNWFKIIFDMFKDFFRFNTLFLDYFYFRFFEKNENEKSKYIDTLSMYLFQSKCNSKQYVDYFLDKKKFYEKFQKYIVHSVFSLDNNFDELKKWMFLYKPKEIVCKNRQGQVGSNIEIFDVELVNNDVIIGGKFDLKVFYNYLISRKLDLIEERIVQHKMLSQIYPRSLNTIRIISFLTPKGDVKILGAILRMGYDKNIDNFDAGGISAVIDQDGCIRQRAVIKSPIINLEFDKHPITNSNIVGVQIPYWNDCINIVKEAALVIPQVRTVGWDVVITDKGVSLLEGNNNWDKTHWQLCYKKGNKDQIAELLNCIS